MRWATCVLCGHDQDVHGPKETDPCRIDGCSCKQFKREGEEEDGKD